MREFALLFPALLVLFSFYAEAQDGQTERALPDTGTIEERFDYLIDRSNRYQDYKVVRIVWLEQLKVFVNDSLQAMRKELAEKQGVITAGQNELEAMKSDLQNTIDDLASANREIDSITFLGALMSKTKYKVIVWTIAGVLLILLLFFAYRFKRSNAITIETQKILSETREDYEAYKKRSMERERVLKRELQDELNKRL